VSRRPDNGEHVRHPPPPNSVGGGNLRARGMPTSMKETDGNEIPKNGNTSTAGSPHGLRGAGHGASTHVAAMQPTRMNQRGLPGWPRALRATLAAAYVGVSESAFYAHIASAIPHIHPTPGTTAWLREDLDAYLDSLTGGVTASAEKNPWH